MKILKSRFVVTLLTVITIFGLESPVLNTRADGEAVPKMNEYDPIYVETHSLLEDRLEEYLRQEESKKASAKSIAEEYAANSKVELVKNLMKNMKLTLEQALNATGITGKERAMITKQLQN